MGLTADFGAFSAIGSLSPHSLIGRFNHPPPEQADLYKALPPREKAMKPKTWTTVLMPFEGTYVPCFVSRAEHEEGIVGLSTGMSSSPLDKGWASKRAIKRQSSDSHCNWAASHSRFQKLLWCKQKAH